MRDIMWRSAAEFNNNISTLAFDYLIILVHNKDDSYETKLIYKEGTEVFEDTPLSEFTCTEFNSFKYKKIAIIDYENTEEK